MFLNQQAQIAELMIVLIALRRGMVQQQAIAVLLALLNQQVLAVKLMIALMDLLRSRIGTALQ